MPMLTDLDEAVRKSGLEVIELPDWKANKSGGDSTYGPSGGVSTHHTGSYDEIGDTSSDLAYAKWMAFTGRPDLDPPLCNLALSAECRVYVCAAGNANGVGEAKAVGPMPHFSDGNAFYIVIEAMNSGSQGWKSVGKDADGNPITQYDAYVALCGALCMHYGWDPSHIRAHWETSVTGKWDPGDPGSGAGPDGKSMDMDKFRAAVARWITNQEDPMAGITLDQIRDVVAEEIDEGQREVLKVVRKLFTNQRVILRERFAELTDADLDKMFGKVDDLVENAFAESRAQRAEARSRARE